MVRNGKGCEDEVPASLAHQDKMNITDVVLLSVQLVSAKHSNRRINIVRNQTRGPRSECTVT